MVKIIVDKLWIFSLFKLLNCVWQVSKRRVQQSKQRKQFGAFKNAAARVNVKPMVAWLLDHHRVVLYAETLTKTKGFLLSYFCWSARSNGSFGITLMGGSYLLETLWPLVTHFWGQNVPKWLPYGWRKGKRESQQPSELAVQSRSTIRKGGVPPYFDLSSLSMQTWKPECELPVLCWGSFHTCCTCVQRLIVIASTFTMLEKSFKKPHFYNNTSEASSYPVCT